MTFSLLSEKIKWFIQNFRTLRDEAANSFYENTRHEQIILNSKYFDEAYYIRNNPDLEGIESPAEHYLIKGGFQGRDPSEFFCSEEFLTLHSDIILSKLNPLLSYELYGRKANYEISTLQIDKETPFPTGTRAITNEHKLMPGKQKRAAIVSCYFSDGIIPETLLILLRGLREITDIIVLIGDCPVYPTELEKLDEIVCYAKFQRHYQYDFGSYKEGLKYLRSSGLLDSNEINELIMLNDSCYGPIYPFSEAFQRMESEPCDFWGMVGYQQNEYRYFKSHICSYFMVFRNRIVASSVLDDFLNNIHGRYDRDKVITNLETELTNYLEKKGFLWEALCPDYTLDNFQNSVSLVKKHRIPLVKKKVFNIETLENPKEVLEIIRKNNPDLAKYIQIKPVVYYESPLPSVTEHVQAMDQKAAVIGEKYKKGNQLKVLFLIPSYAEFSGKLLFDKMRQDSEFDPYAAVIPDYRLKAKDRMEVLINMAREEKLLQNAGISEHQLIRIRPDQFANWPDLCEGMDIVCYCTPQNISCFRYQPKYAAGRDFLPVLVNDDDKGNTYDEKVLRFDAYRYMWKVFFSCEETLQKYRKVNPEGGLNGEYTGNMRNDLQAVEKSLHKLKTRLIQNS